MFKGKKLEVGNAGKKIKKGEVIQAVGGTCQAALHLSNVSNGTRKTQII